MIGISIMKELKDPTEVFLMNGKTIAFVMLLSVKFWWSHRFSDKLVYSYFIFGIYWDFMSHWQ